MQIRGLIWRDDVASDASGAFFHGEDGGEGVDTCFGGRDVRLPWETYVNRVVSGERPDDQEPHNIPR